MRKLSLLLAIFLCSAAAFAQNTTEGTLYAVDRKGVELGACPLKSTRVQTEISGFLARVRVYQEFENNFNQPIEAVYTFPLSQNAAVDDMTMRVGERVVRGKILKKEEAAKVYETAKSQGKTASLLDQERPNIFTQSVANITPNDKIIIEISYVETLKYEDGNYEFVFPMTVGPRYIPSSVNAADARKILPPVAKTRAGHDVSIEINLNAGVPVEEIRSTSHEITALNISPSAAKITLKNEKTIPNKDFVLRYDVTGKKIEDAILTHRDGRGGFFSMILQPPDKFAAEDYTPKEIVFVLDTSGSMGGFPLDKAREAMRLSLDNLNPNDTFNLITFAGDTSLLFDAPVPATRANLDRAREFLDSRSGGGGTEMMKAIRAALAPSDSQAHLRIVCFMTDGYVGNEGEILQEIQKHPNARIFSFGIGSSVNRFLLDKMAAEGKGEVEYVSLEDDGSRAAKKFYERVRTPVLTDISIDWNGLPVGDIYPNRLTDLFSAKPVIVYGRFTQPASGTIRLKGKIAGQNYVREIAVNLPEASDANDVLATLWARTKVDELTSRDYNGVQNGNAAPEIQQTITNIGLEFRLLTQFTSFVAVEERIVNQNGAPTRVDVPVELPEGVNREMTLGEDDKSESRGLAAQPLSGRREKRSAEIANAPASVTNITLTPNQSIGSGQGSGIGNGSGSGSGGSSAATVEITAGNSVAVDTSDSKISTNVSGQTVQNLPVNGRQFSSLLKISPGVQVEGASGSENTFVIDGTEVTSLRTGKSNSKNSMPKTISGGVINGRAVSLPKPAFPAAARAVKASGAVIVQVLIDENGQVVRADAVSGHPLLRAAAEKAARAAKFAPTAVAGKAVKIAGVIVYNFKKDDLAEIKITKMRAGSLTAEEKRNAVLAEKLHVWIFDLVERLAKNGKVLTPNESKFFAGGKAEIQVWLSDNSPQALEKLKLAGFESVESKQAKFLVGVIAPEKIALLAEIAEVQYVLPNIK